MKKKSHLYLELKKIHKKMAYLMQRDDIYLNQKSPMIQSHELNIASYTIVCFAQISATMQNALA